MKKINQNYIKKVMCFICAAAVMVTTVSCGNEEIIEEHETADVLRFSWWGKDNSNENTLKSINNYEKAVKNISIKPEYSDYQSFKTRMDVEIYSNTEADLMMLDYEWLKEYAGSGLYDLNEFSDIIKLDNISNYYLSLGQFEDKLYGIPTGIDSMSFYYNENIYDKYDLKIPETWDDLYNAAKVMKHDEIYPLSLSKTSAWFCAAAYAEQKIGQPMYGGDGYLNYTPEDFKIMIDFYVDLLNKKVTPRADEFSRINFQNCILGGICAWNSETEYYCLPMEKAGYKISVGNYIEQEGEKAFGWHYKPTAFYAIKKNSANPKEAAKLLEYMINSDSNALCVKNSGGVPISSSALETLEAHGEMDGVIVEGNRKITLASGMNLMNGRLANIDIIDYFINICESVYFEKVRPEQAAKNLYGEITEYYKLK